MSPSPAEPHGEDPPATLAPSACGRGTVATRAHQICFINPAAVGSGYRRTINSARYLAAACLRYWMKALRAAR
jgi:hypothetical protein